MMILPPPTGWMKLSCFSAVTPVSGWNQWVKCVAPCSKAQTFMPSAMSFATSSGSGVPVLRQFFHAWNAEPDTYCCIAASLNTLLPNNSGIFSFDCMNASSLQIRS